MDALKCFDADMNPVHEDLPLDEVQDGIHRGCGNIVLMWQDADDTLMEEAHEHGVSYMFTFSDSPGGNRRYAQAHMSIP